MTRSRLAMTLSAAAALLWLGAPLQAAEDGLIRVHCRGAGQGDFLDKEVADATKDLSKALRGKKKTLVLVEASEAADVVVTVTGRIIEGTGHREYTTTSSGKGNKRRTRTSSREKTVKVVYATLEVGDFSQPMTGSATGFWTLAASDLAGEIDGWLKENRGQILARRH